MLVGATTVGAAGKLNVSNWAEYMAEDTIANFAKEYDVEVTFTPYDSAEAIDAKLLAGSSGYDVVSHASSMVARLIPGAEIETYPGWGHDFPSQLIPTLVERIAGFCDGK